jgi:hypothetical protein
MRLQPFLPELVDILKRCGELTMTGEIEAQLCQMNPSTILDPDIGLSQLQISTKEHFSALYYYVIPRQSFTHEALVALGNCQLLVGDNPG